MTEPKVPERAPMIERQPGDKKERESDPNRAPPTPASGVRDAQARTQEAPAARGDPDHTGQHLAKNRGAEPAPGERKARPGSDND